MYKRVYEFFKRIVEREQLLQEKISCEILIPPPKLPSKEYALEKGREVILQCRFRNSIGQAFTSKPKEYKGKIKDVLKMVFGKESEKAIFFSVLNAVFRELGFIEGTVHCKGVEAELCGVKMADYASKKFSKVKIVHIGYQPGHIKALINKFGEENVLVTDLNPENIGKSKFGTKIIDGSLNKQVITGAGIVFVTGSTIINNTLPEILKYCKIKGIEVLMYGVTGKAAAKILNIKNFCPYGH